MNYLRSLQIAMHDMAESMPNFMVIGEDISDPYGGAFKVTRGLSTKYPDKLISSPISEAAIIGLGCGRAIKQLPTIVEIMFGDFITLGCDQIINQASKIQSMYGYPIKLPLVIRVPMGGYRGYGPTHSQSLESIFVNTCQIKIISPNIFIDPGKLLHDSLLCGDLTLFVEHKSNYPLNLVGEIFNDYEIYSEKINGNDKFPSIKIGLKICENQKIDAYIFTYGYQVNIALQAAIGLFMDYEYNVVVIAYTDILNLDLDEILGDKSSGKFFVLQEANQNSGWGNYACTLIQDKFFKYLKAPVFQLGAFSSPIPSALSLEKEHLPSIQKTYDEILNLINFK